MSTVERMPRIVARLQSVLGTALMTLGVVVAIGVGVLIVTSMRASRTLRTPSYAAPNAGPRSAEKTGVRIHPLLTGESPPGARLDPGLAK